MKIKARKMILFFRIAALFDVLFSRRFDLTTYSKEGRRKASTHFDKQEILDKLR